MYIKLGRLNILPTSDPKSANSRYFQGHQLINVRFLSQSQPPNDCPSSIVVNIVDGSRNITFGFDSEETYL
jgi:hypothetical protein